MDNGGNFFAAAPIYGHHHHHQPPNPTSYHGPSITTFSNNAAMEQEVDPHLVSLQLGKRDYYVENGGELSSSSSSSSIVRKKGRQMTVARCQVEECGAELRDAKEYHRRHKVCEVHAKATSVVVHGLHQRFCQQCSRFHRVNEFDEAKRSCRRRLAGHNERRRKSPHVSLSTSNASQERALSLLSSESDYYPNAASLSLSSSAALNELIAENRAALLAARQLMLLKDMSCSQDYTNAVVFPSAQAQHLLGPPFMHHHHQLLVQDQQDWCHGQQEAEHVTLDLMHSKQAQEREACTAQWHSLNGAHIS
ncbi:hypothetical protein Drorol1_Dr00005048 [Drosera rotundifolia]